METTNEKNLATFTHLSTLTQYCIPFGNFIFPIVIWSSYKDKSALIDANGKQALNFQLSVLLYTLVLAMIAIPILIISFFNIVPLDEIIHSNHYIGNHFSLENFSGMLLIGLVAILLLACLKVTEFILILIASVKASNGEEYRYPLCIPFIK